MKKRTAAARNPGNRREGTGSCSSFGTPNRDTLALFCRLGVECVLLAHLIGTSPMVLWHGLCPRTSSVTTVITEERRPGVAVFRINAMGDTAHLYAAGIEPSFAARFCETWDSEERHD